MAKVNITQPDIKKLVHYDPNTGFFTWRESRKGASKGKRVGNRMGIGYIEMRVYGTRYLGHRLAWLYMTGEIPPEQVDHINHIRDDNRWCNLRLASISENRKNQSLNKRNTSGIIGVSFDKSRGKWEAKIKSDGKYFHLGRYADINDAVAARKAAEQDLGFHSNHGQP